MPSVGFEPINPESKRLQTYALDRAASGIAKLELYRRQILPKTSL